MAPPYSARQIADCIPLLQYLAQNSEQLVHLTETQRIALLTAAGRLSRPQREEINRRRKEANRTVRQAAAEKERRAREATGIRKARQAPVFKAPLKIAAAGRPDGRGSAEASVLNSPRNCYVCKAEYRHLHFFYDAMCPKCGDLNYRKRFQTVSLAGRVALITGARLKIGYQATLMMLRAGARVIATTRFPVDAALRYSGEEDYVDWKERLHIHGLDLRHTPSVELFANYVAQTYARLDILINNAAQTVRRPPGFYAHLMANENLTMDQLSPSAGRLLSRHAAFKRRLDGLSGFGLPGASDLPVAWNGPRPGIGLRASAQLSQIPYPYDNGLADAEVFPQGRLDADLQQVDLRTTNSWRLCLGDIQTPEMLEVQLVNAVAPFVLCNRLIALMRCDPTGQKHIVNVTAMEGKFHRFKQASRHPHTNMAKAALNMLTHTAAKELARDGIYINAVDTGWVTDEDPAALAERKKEIHDFQPPLDIVDGAARICDPFFHGILTGRHWSGKFLKDYLPIDW